MIHDPSGAKDIAAILTEKGGAGAMRSARAVIDGFWCVRLLEIPASQAFRQWKKEWESLFP